MQEKYSCGCVHKLLKGKVLFLLVSEGKKNDNPAFLMVFRLPSCRFFFVLQADRIDVFGYIYIYIYAEQARIMLYSSLICAVGSCW